MSISVITPVFNRALLVYELYESLMSQQSYDFEWVIIDDGSTDNLKEVIDKIASTSPFKIIYRYKKNGGKHTALNIGIEMSSFNWIFIVDSDDILTPNAIALANEKIQAIVDDKCKGMVFLRGYKTTKEIVGKAETIENISLEKFAGTKGDKALIIKRDSLLKNQFPVFDGENFITEALVWNSILENGYFKYFNEIIYYSEYLPGGLTSNYTDLLRKNINGTMAFVINNLNLKGLGINVIKQTVFHFIPIFNISNLIVVKKKTRFTVFVLFITCLFLVKIKNKIKG
ncbi:glycosyltransferase family 2 protein [Escherichia fergusonii]|nr:glycosyltransferase family 2 protein [Escherichia fergusonii]